MRRVLVLDRPPTSSACALRVGVVMFVGGICAAPAACGSSVAGGSATQSATDAGSPTQPETTAVVDAGPPPDNGAPSDHYPAPHPKAPTVQSYGGTVLTAPRVQPIFFPNDPMSDSLTTFTKALPGTSYWHDATAEYGVGDITTAEPIVVSTADVALTSPMTITDDQIQAFIAAHLDGTHAGWGTPDPSTIYTVFYPVGVTVTMALGASCQAFGGYHNELKVGSTSVAYAVLPRCSELANLHGEDVVTGATSHELIEAATDPFPNTAPAFASADEDHLYYDFMPLSEVGDMCAYESDAFFKPTEVGFTVQRTWSDVAASAGKPPCAPALDSSIYFGAVPVQTQTVNMDFGPPYGSAPVKGVVVPLAKSVTIEVDLFSQGAMDPFYVKAYDVPSYQGKNAELSFAWDRETGQNGEKLHLTITRTASGSQYGGTEFAILAYSDATHYHQFMGYAANAAP